MSAVASRFLEKFSKDGAIHPNDPSLGRCWDWSAVKSGKGYGNFKLDGSMKLSHRVAYELYVEPIPSGMLIDHTCHNHACVNPSHLRLATNKQNMENQTRANKSSRSGHRGVIQVGNRWRAQAKHRGVNHYRGPFSTIDKAIEASRSLRNELFTHNDQDRIAS